MNRLIFGLQLLLLYLDSISSVSEAKLDFKRW
jgi:hypothetical protein